MPRIVPVNAPELPACVRDYQRLRKADLVADPAVREQVLDYVMDRAMQDASLTEIALEINMSGPSLHRALYEWREDSWKEVQIARMLHKYQEAERMLREAPDQLSVSRAREWLRSLQWQLERLYRRLYGTDSPKDSAGRITINLNMGAPGVGREVDVSLADDSDDVI